MPSWRLVGTLRMIRPMARVEAPERPRPRLLATEIEVLRMGAGYRAGTYAPRLQQDICPDRNSVLPDFLFRDGQLERGPDGANRDRGFTTKKHTVEIDRLSRFGFRHCARLDDELHFVRAAFGWN